MNNSRLGFTLIELLMVVAIVGLAILLLLPAAQSAREAARRVQCASNLRQIGLAMHDYHDEQGTLPPGANGCCRGTWLLFVLPYIEQSNLYNSWNFIGANGSDDTSSTGRVRLLRRGQHHRHRNAGERVLLPNRSGRCRPGRRSSRDVTELRREFREHDQQPAAVLSVLRPENPISRRTTLATQTRRAAARCW